MTISSPIEASEPPVIPVWGEDVPQYQKPHDVVEFEDDCWGGVRCALQVVEPTMTLFLPRNASNDSLVVVIPGGGYEVEAVYHEGLEIAAALAARGTAAAMLKYRLPNPKTAHHPELVPLADLRQALKTLRARREELGIEATRFGVLGFSAGSHLATTASVRRSKDPSENPDFSLLVYGVTRLTPENREWLETALYHRPMTPQEIERETLLDLVDAETPPAFLVHALDDETCHYSETTEYAEALTRHEIEAEVHLFARGGHGFGAGRAHDGTVQWLDLASSWIDRIDPHD